ncbi:DciA family protein [Streptomyces diastatochromogenes]|nr:DciA family protein [Streptomyces diastatochromogenes]
MTQTETTAAAAAVASGSGQPAPELSGVDLARVALHQAREAAKARGENAVRKTKRRTGTTVRRDGREPAGFATVLQGLMADRAWETPAAGGSILDQWPDIAATLSPKLAVHVTATAFHPETGQLDLRPDSPAYATQLRLITTRIIATANQWSGTGAVRSVRVLAVGTAPATHRPVPQNPAMPDTAAAPVKTRETASAGYHQALAAHRATTPPSRTEPTIAQAVERQTRAMRELSRRAFPEPGPVADDQPAPIEQARAERRRAADASHAAALRRARAERSGAAAGGTAFQALPHTA